VERIRRIRLDSRGPRLAERIADLEAGRLRAVTPRDAATVMVLRAPDGLNPGPGAEVLMMRRTAAMKFAPGAYVFPGGSVDPADYSADIGWQGPSPGAFGAKFGATPEQARALVCAAVRETFEEAGVLLASQPGSAAPPVPSGPSWEADRLALTAGELTLSELLGRRGLVVRADLLVPWARWATPSAEPRRFDARFFAAVLPPGQEAAGHAAEADHVAWLDPASAIESARAGEISMLPPTAVTLQEFAAAVAAGQGPADITGQWRDFRAVTPRMVLEDGVVWLLVPDEIEYPL
jgi:8-oxo-dGTP pyrophosphatase MutT (NUDIX family)